MATLAVNQPIIGRILPQHELGRIAAYGLFAILGTVALWISAKISVPFWPVPMTMQTFAILVIGGLYGARLGFLTLLLYLAEGAMGLPVFSGTPERGIGMVYMMGPTGGYLLAFPIAAALVGWFAERGWDRSPIHLAAIMTVATAFIFVLGVIWLGSVIGWEKPVLELGVTPFIPGAILKIALAVICVAGISRYLPHRQGQRRGKSESG